MNSNDLNLHSYCDLYGYIDGKSILNNILKDIRIKTMHIDMYQNKPCYSLLLRSNENNVEIVPDNDRLILRNSGKGKRTIMNILKKDIDDCIYKRYDDNRYEIILSWNEIMYKMFVALSV